MNDRLLRAYDSQLRGAAEVAGSDWHDRSGPLWRTRYGDDGFVSYEQLDDADVARLVPETVAFFRDETDVASFEWKTRGHDLLPSLTPVLLEHGFEAEDLETVMVGEASALAVDVPLREGLSVRRVVDHEGFEAVRAVQREVFDHDSGDLAGSVERSQGLIEVWAAYDGDRAVSSGRLVVVAGTEFAGLWGGGTLASHRGLGIYRALTAARARSALARGVRLLQSDCTPMSRPILERSGLRAITTTTPYVWKRPA